MVGIVLDQAEKPGVILVFGIDRGKGESRRVVWHGMEEGKGLIPGGTGVCCIDNFFPGLVILPAAIGQDAFCAVDNGTEGRRQIHKRGIDSLNNGLSLDVIGGSKVANADKAVQGEGEVGGVHGKTKNLTFRQRSLDTGAQDALSDLLCLTGIGCVAVKIKGINAIVEANTLSKGFVQCALDTGD